MRVGDMRREVIERDGGCQAPVLDPLSGPCYDQWGGPFDGFPGGLQMDYVRRDAVGPRHLLAADHLALCPGHHLGTGPQGGQVWATSHREMMAAHLEPMRSEVRSEATHGD